MSFDVLAVEPDGTIMDPPLAWSFCHTPKPPAEANAVSQECLDTPDDAGPAPTLMAALPSDGCMTFGPQPPPVQPGQPQIRPRDPDGTGGFYQPFGSRCKRPSDTDVAFELERITCMLANAPIDVTRMFNLTYTANQNPAVDHVTLDPDGAATPLVGAGRRRASPWPAGATVTLELGWPAEAPESYPVWDLASRTLVTHREALRVSWFASAGSFPKDTTGRGEEEPEPVRQERLDGAGFSDRRSLLGRAPRQPRWRRFRHVRSDCLALTSAAQRHQAVTFRAGDTSLD